MKVLITGATGLVGSRLLEVLGRDVEFVSLGRHNGFDLARPEPSAWAKRMPKADALLHAAAKTNVDAVEQERGQGEASEAMRVHRDATRALQGIGRERGIPTILVSTDFVFPAATHGPFPEGPAPTRDAKETSWYGWTKLLAEREIDLEHGTILRISYPYRARFEPKTDHARNALDLHAKGRLYPLFTDQTFTPTFIDDAADAIRAILRKGIRGIVHCAAQDALTPFDFVTKLLHACGQDANTLPRGHFAEAARPGRAHRPQHGGLDTTKSRAAGLPGRPVDESLREFARQYRAAMPK